MILLFSSGPDFHIKCLNGSQIFLIFLALRYQCVTRDLNGFSFLLKLCLVRDFTVRLPGGKYVKPLKLVTD